MYPRTAARALAAVFGLWLVAFGLWAFFAPASFYARIATIRPTTSILCTISARSSSASARRCWLR